ncbi:MAG: 16S rRNA (guanine(527)-N(7))-methyltransferase [Legionellales bacterium RIFCSPHIGHO2_12_FULL_42_9]|nr:MAG: 16S rRNA (guanine(527)-N(7))-methyltransferase [Legionellales bacterium RIFCSPHIGHO2_12_FULL_42_9]
MNDELTASALLHDGLEALNRGQQHHHHLLQYLVLLKQWNQAYNLTAVRELPTMVTRHVLDSLAIAPYLHGNRVLDVGSGAGLPGMVLAITNPALNVVLLDSNGKKIRFLNTVKRSLDLRHVTVVRTRALNYHVTVSFDTVVSRAFSDLSQFIQWTNHLVVTDGIWLAMKGVYPKEELASIPFPYAVHPYQVPGLDEQRCAVIIKK